MRAPPSLLIAAWFASGVLPTSLASPYAVQVVSAQGPFGSPVYADTNAVLGAPATWYYDPLGGFGDGTTNRRVKLVEAASNIAPDTNVLITPNLLLTMGGGSQIIARFDHPVHDNPANPYGLDLLVFGNAFYTPNAFVNDSTDMSTCFLTGGTFNEPLKVSVSPGCTGLPGENPNDPDTWPWYRYDNGPYADTEFPTQAHKWNRAATNWTTDLMDFTKPVNPGMKTLLDAGGLSAADAIDLYAGSGGGTGFDLRASGFSWIQYVKVEGIDPDFSDGEIDAFSIVRPMAVGDELSITPENVISNTAKMFFQQAGQTNRTVVTLDFTAASEVAKVTTATMTNAAMLALLPGSPLNAVELNLTSILGTSAVTFQADLALAVSENYGGNGSDLLVFNWIGTNWNPQPFTFISTNQTVLVAGITNLSAFAVTQFTPPRLSIHAGTNGFALQFTPLPGLIHALERSTNLVLWSTLETFTATNAQTVTLNDDATHADEAFYRVRVQRP